MTDSTAAPDPTDPTEPTKPTDPIDLTGEPEDPADPTEPTDPTGEPEDPTDPTDPTGEPEDPTEPTGDDGDGSGDHHPTTSPPHADDPAGSDTPNDTDARPAQDATGADDGAQAATDESHQLAPRQPRPRGQLASLPPGAPRPPRRTGVFLDPQNLRSHVSDLLRAIVGSHGVDAFGNFTFDHESQRVFVTVSASPVGPIVGVFAVTNTKLSLTPELADWMARTNHRLMLGTLSWDDDNDAVWLRYNLLGSHLDAAELQTAVGAVATTAVQVGTDVHDKFGGARFSQDQGDQGDRDETPDPAASETSRSQSEVGRDGSGGDDMFNTTGYL